MKVLIEVYYNFKQLSSQCIGWYMILNIFNRLSGPGITLFLIPQVSDTSKRQAFCMARCDSGQPLSKRCGLLHKQTIKHSSEITVSVMLKMIFNNSADLARAFGEWCLTWKAHLGQVKNQLSGAFNALGLVWDEAHSCDTSVENCEMVKGFYSVHDRRLYLRIAGNMLSSCPKHCYLIWSYDVRS